MLYVPRVPKTMMVELVGAWRGLEHRKLIAVKAARAQLGIDGD